MSLDKHWRDTWAEQLKELGHEVPDNWTKDQVRAKLDEVKGKAPKLATNEEAKVAIDSESSKRIAQLEAMVAKMSEQFAAMSQDKTANLGGLTGDALVQAILKAADGRQNEYGLLRSEWIPPEDIIPTRVYYMAAPTTNIWGKMVGNTMTPPPRNKPFIKFKEAYGWVTKGSTGVQQRRVATFECKDRVIAEFIESLPEFGHSIFLNVDKAMNATVNSEFTQLYNRHKASLADVSYGKIMQMAIEMGCPSSLGNSHDDYAAYVAEKRALADQERNRQKFESNIRAKGIHQLVNSTQPVG